MGSVTKAKTSSGGRAISTVVLAMAGLYGDPAVRARTAGNLAAPYHAAIAASRRMLAQPEENGIKGKIVNVGDWASNRPYRDYLPYLVAKGGLATFTQALAVELAPHVTVNMVQPAMVDPPPSSPTRSATP